ncbi:MAG: AsnC family transcriptional regulator [Candidatus Thorarchaeota archaeon]
MDGAILKHDSRNLDRKDLKILSAITSLGGKISAEQLSSVSGIPSRTIRYRLSKLRERGHLKQLLAQTHEASLGLGDSIILINLKEGMTSLPQDFFTISPLFYFWSPTYGKYNGYILHSVYPANQPGVVAAMIRMMQRVNVVSEYFIFFSTDYISTGADLSKFSSDRGLIWDWREWTRDCESHLNSGQKSKLDIDYNPPPIDFDWKDIELIKQLKINARIKRKELGKKVSLSESQVSARICRLETVGVIKGYRWVLKSPEQPLFLYCFFELKKPEDPILSCLHNLPFPKELYAEDRRRYCLRLSMDSKDLVGFYRGFDYLKEYLQSYFFQTMHDLHDQQLTVGQLYSKKTSHWEIPVDEYIQEMKKYLEGV